MAQEHINYSNRRMLARSLACAWVRSTSQTDASQPALTGACVVASGLFRMDTNRLAGGEEEGAAV